MITNGIIMAVLHKKNDMTTQGNVRYFKDRPCSWKLLYDEYNYFIAQMEMEKKLGNGLKAIIGRCRFFGGCICPAAGFTYLCFKTSFTSIYVYRWPEDSSLCLILIFSWEEYWNVSWKNLESKSWLDSKILINICGFISTTVIFASLFSLFFASVDRFSLRVITELPRPDSRSYLYATINSSALSVITLWFEQ